jgi:adenine-specific DNA-methyltransferase
MHLTDIEKEQLKAMIDRGEKLPAKYKSQLFENVPEVELVWAGKTSEVTNVVLPFQSIEQIDEPRKDANMVAGKDSFSLFSCDTNSGRQQSGWSNKLIWGDNKWSFRLQERPMRERLKRLAVEVVYIDPRLMWCGFFSS